MVSFVVVGGGFGCLFCGRFDFWVVGCVVRVG